MHTHGVDSSGWSSIPVLVQSDGSSNPLIVLPVTSCSKEVQAKGIAPGSVVTVVDMQNGSTLGSSGSGRPANPANVKAMLALATPFGPCGQADG